MSPFLLYHSILSSPCFPHSSWGTMKTDTECFKKTHQEVNHGRFRKAGSLSHRNDAYPWENNFRGTIFDYRDSYVATVRLIFSIPLDREEVPENAPVVDPMIFVLVEDTVLKPIEVVAFEEAMTPILAKKLASNVFTPDRIVYFYPSPAEGAETK